ncbi:MAG: hypothetical protein KAY24_12580 [Candidatus Eisenbacteria sp.]|nr:hypothetical protein [Candidatus Eisenbacteria bacterium]
MAKDEGKFRRHGGRWIRESKLYPDIKKALAKEDVPRASQMLHRRGGRWVPRKALGQESRSIAGTVAGCLWLLLVPFIGINYAHQAFVQPTVADCRSDLNRNRGVMLNHKDKLRVMLSEAETETQRISAEIDTLYRPQIEFYETLLDSLLAQRVALMAAQRITDDTLDSLRATRDQLGRYAQALDDKARDRAAVLSNLGSWCGVLSDSLDILSDKQAMASETPGASTDRLKVRVLLRAAIYLVAPAFGLAWAHRL